METPEKLIGKGPNWMGTDERKKEKEGSWRGRGLRNSRPPFKKEKERAKNGRPSSSCGMS